MPSFQHVSFHWNKCVTMTNYLNHRLNQSKMSNFVQIEVSEALPCTALLEKVLPVIAMIVCTDIGE